VIGPEGPLAAGLADDLRQAGLAVFGPGADGARLEASKDWAKTLMREAGIPTAGFWTVMSREEGLALVRSLGRPLVVKADGLAAGKGVVVAETLEETEAAIDDCFGGRFGAAGRTVVLEERLRGPEVSVFAFTDGTDLLLLPPAQDHKRIGEGDTGPNTGGMGAYSPAPIMSDAMSARVMAEIVAPTMAGMKARGAPYRGVLFVGLMIGASGPKLIEFNARFGDPETQVMLQRLDCDLLPLLLASANGALPQAPIALKPQTALTVVYAANGYPDSPERGSEINGLEQARAQADVTITHAGTKLEDDKLIANGGRVLNVTALGEDVADARRKAYAALEMIDWPGGFYRRDIGWRALAR
jgi:phosphoribosylamine--glycine ligase